MKNKKEKMVWVKINKSCVNTEKESDELAKLITRYKMEYNTQTHNAMWFNTTDKSCKDAGFKFAVEVVKKIPYLNVTIGYSKE